MPPASRLTNATAAKTAAFAASIEVRRGTASTLARIIPEEYSLAITIAPSTQSGNLRDVERHGEETGRGSDK